MEKVEGKVQFLRAKALHVSQVFGHAISQHSPPPAQNIISLIFYILPYDCRHMKSLVFGRRKGWGGGEEKGV